MDYKSNSRKIIASLLVLFMVLPCLSFFGGIKAEAYGETFIIDPGHGGRDPGALGSNPYREEADDTLRLSLRVGEIVSQYTTVTYTRTTDKYLELAERSSMANSGNHKYLISIHASMQVPIFSFIVFPAYSNSTEYNLGNSGFHNCGFAFKTISALPLSDKSNDFLILSSGIENITDDSAIREIIKSVINANPQSVEDYKQGHDRAIKFLMGYIKKHDFKVFGYYRIVLGIIVLLYFLFI